MPTYCFAVQAEHLNKFDPYGCTFCTDINHAYDICRAQPGMMIWGIPSSGKGEPVRWCRPDANSNAVAQLVYGKGL